MEHVYNCMGHEIRIPDVVDSDGCWVVADDGTRYLDLESGIWCAGLGHKNERVVRAATEQLDRLMHAGYCYSAEVVDEAARLVLGVTGLDGGRCVFLCSGSEAIEISRQIARHLTGKPLSMTLADSYLGAYSAVTDRSRGWHLFDWQSCTTCPLRESCDPECPLLEEIPREVSDFVFEPGSSSGFVRFPPKSLIRNIARRVRENGGKVIANEVTTGTGRTGRWFGYQHYDLVPDMVAAGKGIGNGYPVSVAVLDGATMDELERKPFRYGQSHLNDPLGAAIVAEVVRTLDESDLIAEAARKGELFLDQLRSLVDGETVLEARGRGLMMAVDLRDAERTAVVYEELLRKGFIVCNRTTSLRIDPPLILGEEEFGSFVDAFREILGQWQAAP